MTAKIKGSAKKGAKKPALKQAKSAAKKKSKSLTPARAAVKQKKTAKKVAPKKSINSRKQAKKAPVRNVKTAARPKAKNIAHQPVTTPILTHGANQHYIPLHIKNAPAPLHDGKKEEQIFHNREEVALHQENQRIKASMATRMGKPKNLRILARG